MANRIKGITIELDGETKGLDKALSNVNKRSKELQGELRDVDRLLKFNPGNADLIAQKQQLLAKEVGNTSEKLTQLRAAQADVDRQFAEGRINEEQYRGFQRELISTESRLRELEQRLTDSQSRLREFGESAIKTGESLKNVGDGMKSVGKDMSMKITAPIVAAGATMFKFANDQETAFAQVSTLLEGSAADFDKYKKDIRAASSEMGVSMEDYSEAVYSSLSAGQSQADAIAFTTKAVKLAGGGFTSTANAVDVMTTALNAYGLQSSEAANISDMLIMTQNLGKTTVDELSASMGKVIPIAQAQGVGFDQLSAAYAALTKNGLATAEAGTGMKAMFGELGKAGSKVDKILRKKTGKSFSELSQEGKNTGDVLGSLQKEAEKSGLKLSDLFGSVQAGGAALTLAKNGGVEFQEMLDEMKTSVGATEKAFNKMADTTQDKMAIALTSVKNMMASFGDLMLPTVAKIAEIITSLISKFDGMDDAIKKNILVFGGIAAAIGPILVVLGILMVSIGSIMTAIGTFSGALAVVVSGASAATPAIGALASVFTFITGPIGIAIAAIAGIVAAFVLAYNKVEWFREGVHSVFNSIKDVIKSVMDSVASFLSEKLSQIKTYWDENGQQIKDATMNVWNAIKSVIEAVMPIIQTVISVAWKFIQTIISSVWDNIKGVISGALDIILGLVKTFSGLFTGDWQGMWDGIKQMFSGTIDFLWNAVQLMLWGKLLKGIAIFAGSFRTAASTMWTSIQGVFTNSINAIRTFFTSGFNAMKTVTNTTMGSIRTLITTIWNTIKSVFTTVINTIKNTVTTGFSNVTTAIRTQMSNAVTAVRTKMSDMLGAIKDKVGDFLNVGKDLIRGLIIGINEMAVAAVEAITGVVDGIVDKAKSMLKIASPIRKSSPETRKKARSLAKILGQKKESKVKIPLTGVVFA